MLRLTYQCELSSEFYRLPEAITSRILSGALAGLGNRFDVSEGLIVAQSRLNKTSKIKPGRVLARLLESPEEVQRLAAILTAPPFTFTILTGSAIAEIYSGEENRTGNRYSCMSGQDEEVFDIYTQNPEQVGLLVVRDCEGEYLGRTLVYMRGGEPKHHSRRFYMDDSTRLLALEWLHSRSITPITPYSSWELDRTEFERYPYLDDFTGVDSDGFTDHDPEHVCDRTDGYARDAGSPCTCCGDHTPHDDLIYIGEDHSVCEHCYRDEYYTGEDSRGRTYVFHADSVTVCDTVSDDCCFANKDDCLQETKRIESDYSDIVLVILSDGTIGTVEELEDNGYVKIEDYWTTEAMDCCQYVVTDGWYAPTDDGYRQY